MIHIVCIELELKHISQRVGLAIKASLPSDLEHFDLLVKQILLCMFMASLYRWGCVCICVCVCVVMCLGVCLG